MEYLLVSFDFNLPGKRKYDGGIGGPACEA
jgi:hypothetical protein